LIKIFSPFPIRLGNLPEVVLGYVNLADVHPHEEADPKVLEATRRYITNGKIIKDPIIVDWKSGVILDGTHRYAVASELGLQRVPAACVDYMDGRIKVKGWVLAVMGGTEVLNSLVSRWERVERPIPGRINLLYEGKYFASEAGNPRDLLRQAQDIKTDIERSGGINLREPFPNRNLPTIFLPYPNKWEVISSGLNKELYPPKSTRHVIPGRPINLNFSLEGDEDIRKMLFNRKFRLMPPRSRVGRKVFEEEVLFFESALPRSRRRRVDNPTDPPHADYHTPGWGFFVNGRAYHQSSAGSTPSCSWRRRSHTRSPRLRPRGKASSSPLCPRHQTSLTPATAVSK